MQIETYYQNLLGLLADARELRALALQVGDTAKAEFYARCIAEHEAEIAKRAEVCAFCGALLLNGKCSRDGDFTDSEMSALRVVRASGTLRID